MRVLVACEHTGIVRDAFRALGHDAWSADLLASLRPGPHIQGDLFLSGALGQPWDLLIAHPPCTYLANSGVRWLHTRPERWGQMLRGADFFRTLWEADVPRIAIENPVIHKYAKECIGVDKATQTIQPYQFGHRECKRTCLWLKGLPPLVPTDDVEEETMALPYAQRCKVHYASPGEDRWAKRSATYAGIAAAMAAQWGGTA